MKMSNKSAGTQFEREFASRLAAEGFWVHRFQDNKNGQPCDVIAARDGEAYLFDCKDCKTDMFSLRRVEENQFNAMRLFDTTGNRRGMFAIRYPDQVIYLVDYEIARIIRDNGKSSTHMLETSPIDVVQTLLGHEKLDTTKIYAKTSMMVIKDNFYRSHL